MPITKTSIDTFIDHFQGQVAAIESVPSPMLRKLVYLTALDPLARAAFGNIGHRERITKLISQLTNWNARHLISLPQLHLNLSESPHNDSRLLKAVQALLAQWPSGHILPIRNSPQVDDLTTYADANEIKMVTNCSYTNLFYTYRNSLVHEFREPGYGFEFSIDKEHPYYTSTIDGPWELVFPVGFFSYIFQEALIGLKAFLTNCNINPYEQFDFGSLWRSK